MIVAQLGRPDESALLIPLGLFDADWYCARYPDVKKAALDPFTHWYDFGWRESRQPNPYFEPDWYLQRNPHVMRAGLNPLLHYGLYGDYEGRSPSPHFDPRWYRRAYSLQANVSALGHFLRNRNSGKYLPTPQLYAAPFIYSQKQGDWDDDPFLVAISQAEEAGGIFRGDEAVVATSKLLDPNFYLINGADVHECDMDPVEHYCNFGWREGRKPNLYFDTNWYLATNKSVGELGVNPLTHYILEGERANRRPVVYFDPIWYRINYRLDESENALAHFLFHRRSQKFSPNPDFDVTWYVNRYGEELGPNRDPFAHYLQVGTLGDINPSPSFSARSYRRKHLGRATRSFRHLMRPDQHNPLVHYLLSSYL